MTRWLIPILLVVLCAPLVADGTGTLTIPNSIGGQPAGAINASLFDANWSAIRTYVNAREITYGTLAARPAAGTSGRYYYATDTSQFFGDNGSAWVNLVSGGASGVYAVRGLQGANNSGTPATQFDFSADQVALRSPSDNSITVRSSTGTLTVNISTAGPAANGRDQAAAFTTNTWLHVYFIWNGTTLASLASTTAPPTGPALPTGYTSWAYAGFVRYGDTPGLLRTRWRGAAMFYDVATQIITNGVNTTETTISVASAVAPNATRYGMFIGAVDNDAALPPLSIRTTSGSNFVRFVNASGLSMQVFFELGLPNVSQQFFYVWAATPSRGASFSITNAVMPNGDS